MIHARVHFGAGLILGIVIAAIFFHFFAPRYEVFQSDNETVKQDRWTGDSWRMEQNKWVAVTEDKRDWKPVDQALMDAIGMQKQEEGHSPKSRLSELRQKYPALEPFSDEDIMERIKHIYSKKIIVDLYLSKME